MRTATKSNKEKADEKQEVGVQVKASDVRMGDRLVTKWVGKRIGDNPRSLSPQQAAQMLLDFLENGEQQLVERSVEVRGINFDCNQWRSHRHINGACYWDHQPVWIVKRES